jgi:hypothetical protein
MLCNDYYIPWRNTGVETRGTLAGFDIDGEFMEAVESNIYNCMNNEALGCDKVSLLLWLPSDHWCRW